MKRKVNYFLVITKQTSFLHSRWLRLLFGREFSLPDLLVVWDAIFAAGRHFQLTNYIVVAMLTQIRQTRMFVYRIVE